MIDKHWENITSNKHYYRRAYPIYKIDKDVMSEMLSEVASSERTEKSGLRYAMAVAIHDYNPELFSILENNTYNESNNAMLLIQEATAKKPDDMAFENDYESKWKWTADRPSGVRFQTYGNAGIRLFEHEHVDNPLYEGLSEIGNYNLKFYGNQFKGKHVRRRGNKAHLLQGKEYYGRYSSSEDVQYELHSW